MRIQAHDELGGNLCSTIWGASSQHTFEFESSKPLRRYPNLVLSLRPAHFGRIWCTRPFESSVAFPQTLSCDVDCWTWTVFVTHIASCWRCMTCARRAPDNGFNGLHIRPSFEGYSFVTSSLSQIERTPIHSSSLIGADTSPLLNSVPCRRCPPKQSDLRRSARRFSSSLPSSLRN
jgi:hypothetical protein